MPTHTILYVQETEDGSGNLETRIGSTAGTAGEIEYEELVDQGVYRTGLRPVFVNFRGDIYVCGSFTRPLVRHSTDRRWLLAGIKPPRDLVAVAPGTGAGGSSGDCLAYITFLHKEGDRVMAESNPSNIVDVGTLSGEGRDWSNIQAVDAEKRVTHVRGYVSMNGGDYRMAWEAPYGVTAVSENTTTTRLSLLGPNDFRHNIPPFSPKFMHPWAGRMWYANNPEFPYRVWYSKPGYPQYVGKQQFRDTLEREPVTGLWRGRNEIVVFCEDNSYLIRQFGQGQDDFVMERLDSNVGCITHHGIREIHNRVYFPARDGVWLYDGAFRYLTDDLRSKWDDDFCADPESFRDGFGEYDKLNKVYMFFQIPTIAAGASPSEWEPKTGLTARTVIWVGYIGEFEPSMNGQQLQPDWTWDFRGREDSSALYGVENELYVASCDGQIRRQLKPCELSSALEDYRTNRRDWDLGDDNDTYGAADGEDSLEKKLIIRHGHMLFDEPGDDKEKGKHLEQLWAHLESPVRAWTFYAMGGDEDTWDSIRPDNVLEFWKRTWAASDQIEGRTIDGTTYVYTFNTKSVHYMIPEKVAGRGFTFEVQATRPLLVAYRGIGGMWSPGPAAKRPTSREACTYATLSLKASFAVDLDGGGSATVAASDLDNGSVNVSHWRLELLNAQGAVIQTAQTALGVTDPELTMGCAQVGSNRVRVSVWDKDLNFEPGWEPCVQTGVVTVTVSDPLAVCP